MAVIKYKSGDTFVTLTNYTVQPIVPVQTSGTSLTDVMSQKAVSDGLEKKVDNDELDGKIADAIAESDAVISAITKVISGDSAVSGAVETIVTEKLENYYTSAETKEYISGYTYSKGDIDAALSGKSDVGHTHVVADITDFESGVSSAITSNTEVEKSVNNVISSFTDSVLDDRYAFKQHTHQASAITDFNSEVAQAVKTEITNNNSAITESIENVIEKYIYGEGGASSSASVVTTENLETTLADYAKTADIPTDLSGFTNSPKYIKENDINGLIASAITDNQAVIDAVNSAITSAITSDTAVQNAIDSATANKFGEVEYDSVNKRINFYATSAKTSVIDYIDATDFIKDGMVDNVAISGSDLVITFNTDAGKEPISLALTDIFNPNNYYDRDTSDGRFAPISHTHTASQITDFNSAVSGAVKNNTEVKNEIISAVTASTEFSTLNSNVNSISGTVTGHTTDTTIHVTSTEKNSWNAKSDFSGSYNDLTDKPTIPTVPTSNTAFTNDAGYITASALEGYATEAYVNSAITEAGGTTTGTVQTMINQSISGKADSSTTIAGYGITDAKIEGGVITLGNTTITPLTAITSGDITTALGYTPMDNARQFTSSDITDFSSAVEGVVSTSSTISGTVKTIVSDAIANDSTVSGAVESAVDANANVLASKAVTDFLTGHNTVSTLANIPTDKRLVIATISSSTNELSLSGNALIDGYEIHVIVTNSGEEVATVTLPSSGGYISVGDAISIEPSATGEINIISDGTNKYVRGV